MDKEEILKIIKRLKKQLFIKEGHFLPGRKIPEVKELIKILKEKGLI